MQVLIVYTQVAKFQGLNPATGKYVLTAHNQNLIFSVPLVGSIIGAVVASPLNFHFGRKWPLVAAYIISVGGALLQVLAPNLGAFVGGRSISGLAMGIANATAPLYLSEACLLSFSEQLPSLLTQNNRSCPLPCEAAASAQSIFST
jgi:MFS family permease